MTAKARTLRIIASKENQALWRPAKFKTANFKPETGPYIMEVSGFCYKGIGITAHGQDCDCAGKGVEVWSVTHTGSGHRIFNVKGSFGIVVEIATLLANLGDWEFMGLRGFSNMSLDLFDKVQMLYQMFTGYCFQNEKESGRNEELADVIAKAQTQ